MKISQKTGRWNAMHVRIAWEIYHHQAKQNPDKAPPAGMGAKTDLLRPPSHSIFSGTSALPRHPDLTSSAFPASGLPGRPTFDPSPIPTSFLGTPSSHLGMFIMHTYLTYGNKFKMNIQFHLQVVQ